MARVLPTQPPLLPALVRRGAAAAAVGFTVSCGGQTSGADSVQPPQPSGIDAGSTFVGPVDAAVADVTPRPDATATSADAQTLEAASDEAASDEAASEEAASEEAASEEAASEEDADATAPDASIVVPPLPVPPLPPPPVPPK